MSAARSRVTVRNRRREKTPITTSENQSTINEYFSTVYRSSAKGAKRRKLATSSTKAEVIGLSPSVEVKEGNKWDGAPERSPDCATLVLPAAPRVCAVTPEKTLEHSDTECSPRYRKKATRNVETVRSCARRSLTFRDAEEDIASSTADATNSLGSDAVNTAVKADGIAALIANKASSVSSSVKGAKNVAELQQRLAARSVLRKFHQQRLKIKCAQVDEIRTAYASPTGVVRVPSVVSSPGSRGALLKTTGINSSDIVLPSPSVPKLCNFKSKEFDKLEDEALEYGQASRLVQYVKDGAKLPLPKKYERLHKLFQHTERVVGIMHIQGKRITLNEVLTNVQNKLKIEFSRRHFAQIVHVYGEAYILRLEKAWMPVGGIRNKNHSFEVVVEPNFTDDIAGYLKPESPKKANVNPLPLVSPVKLVSPMKGRLLSSALVSRPSPSKKSCSLAVPLPRTPVLDERPKIQAWRAIVRSSIFKYRLQQIIKEQHVAFLEKIGISVKPEEGNSFMRYHPDFDFENVGDIAEAKLPDASVNDMVPHLSMKDLMKDAVDSINTLPQKVQDVIEELKSPEKQFAFVRKVQVSLSPRKYVKECAGKPKGESLLERIRAREREKKQADMLRDPKLELRKARLEKISLSLLRNITSFYAFRKVGCMKLSDLVEKMNFNVGSTSKTEMEEHIALLCEIAPNHFNAVDVCGQKFIKLSNNDYAAISDIVRTELAKCSATPCS